MSKKPFKVQDKYFHKAKAEGFVARSAFKLEEIQKRHKLIKKGDFVLDLGCSPGSWSQLASEIVGPRGFVEGIDLKPVVMGMKNTVFHVKDVFELQPEDLEKGSYEVLISDMAPSTSGVIFQDQCRSEELCMKVLELCPKFLKPGGNMVMKLFMGGGQQEVLQATRALFTKVKQSKPDSTRKASKEFFVIGLGFKG